MISIENGKGEIKTSYEGCVLKTYEENGYDDSDFIAMVWDETTQSIKHVEYATTRGWTYHNSAKIDATEEVKEKARAYAIKQNFEKLKKSYEKQSLTPDKNKIVKVVKGRKVPKGLEGVILWIKEETYNYHNKVSSIGIKDINGVVHRSYTHNVEVINPKQYMVSEKQILIEASRVNF